MYTFNFQDVKIKWLTQRATWNIFIKFMPHAIVYPTISNKL
jgi:hypothetical protein